jgi:C4-dicarboxylate-specific signal transduction histidine kinase
MDQLPQKHFLFRPRARLVAVLGEHLISDQAVGLIELIKNSYDADATEVEVQLLGLDRADSTTVIISDNGCGMTLEDVATKWLSPAVDHKDRAKRASRRTTLGRLPIGEKGVGRFAVHQIGRRLELISRAKGRREIVVTVSWDEFDSGEAFLDAVPVSVIEREPETFPSDATGTRLVIQGARSLWTEALVKKVSRTIRRLQSPLQDDDIRFSVRLRCGKFSQYENTDPTDILAKSHYEFRALISEEGKCDFEYVCRHPAVTRRNANGCDDLVALAAEELLGRQPHCGSFWMNLYIWDRSKDFLHTSGVSRSELDALCGVSVYRDRLRVLPYGEPGDDWLFLDQERIQAPADRIGNNQVIGLVMVDQSTNLQLRDKTNREGLIENEAFLDLRALTRAAVRLFTTHWRRDRPPQSAKVAATAPTGSVRRAREVADAIRDSARNDVTVTLPSDGGANGTGGASPPANRSVQPHPISTVSQRQAVDLLIEQLEGAEEGERDREARVATLLDLAATGLAARRVVHEFGRQVTGAVAALKTLQDDARRGRDSKASIGILAACMETLRNEFRVLAPYEATERVRAARTASAADAARLAVLLNQNYLTTQGVGIEVTGDDFTVSMRPTALIQVLDNLVNNAGYWCGPRWGGPRREIRINLDRAERRIVIGDSGPGVHREIAPHLFQPFVTMKSGGTGLGLHISSELTTSAGGRLRLLDHINAGLPAWITGAIFGLELPCPGDDAMRKARNDG